jgi:hypoxanthine phosphoribosyltransferase
MANLIGKNILIVDEVDDTRTTLEYAVRELEKDVEAAQKQLGREGEKTNFFVYVLHVRYLHLLLHWYGVWSSRDCLLIMCFRYQQNKNKPKKGVLPADMMESGRYHASVTTDDVWICYPWEAKYVPATRIFNLLERLFETNSLILIGTSRSTMLWPRRTPSFKQLIVALANCIPFCEAL